MYPILIALLIVLIAAALPTWWVVSDARETRRTAERQATEKAAREERRRNFKRKVYPALDADVPSPCRNAPAIPAKLSMSESLASDTSALMVCQIILDGEEVHGPFGGWLQDQAGFYLRKLSDLEKVAAKHAHQEWLVKFVHPLQSMVYQRHANGNWNLVRVGNGMF